MPTYDRDTYTTTYSGNETIPDRWTPERQSIWANVYTRLKEYLGSQTSYSVNGSIQFTIGDYHYNLGVTSIEVLERVYSETTYKYLRFNFSETIHTGDSYLEVSVEPEQQHAMYLGPTNFTFYEDLVLNISDETYYYLMVDTINIGYSLTNCTSSNTSTYVNKSEPYVTTLSTNYVGGEFTSVVVTMGDNDITAMVYDNTTHVINIPSVTRDVVITAVASIPTRTITYNLTDCTSTNTQTTINYGVVYRTTLLKNLGYEFTLVRVIHNGVDVTSTAYNPSDNSISIIPVIGDVIITASATLGVISINLYENRTENNRVDKSSYLTLVGTISGVLKDVTSVTTPTIIIERNTIDFNYVRIESLNRYYFVDEVVFIKYNLWQISLKVDVLMSYKNTILAQEGFVSRLGSQAVFNPLLVDDELPVNDTPEYEYFEPTNRSGRTIVDFKYSFENGEPNILYSAVTKVVDVVSSQDDAIPPTGTTLPRIQNRRTPNTCIRLLNYGEYGYLLSACISNDAPASFIRSVLLFPFDLRDIFTDYGTKTASVYAGNNALELGNVWGDLGTQTPVQVYATGKGGSPYILVADFEFSPNGGIDISEDFLNLSSNTQWEIYIPFVGWIQVDAKAMYDKEILIYYTIDLDTGLSTAYIYNQDDAQVIWSGTCQVGLKLPLATTNAEELARQKQAMGLNLAVGLVSSMLSMGMATPIGAVGGIMMGAKSIASAINTNKMMIEKAQTTFGSSDNAMYSPKKIIVKKVTHKTLATTIEDMQRHIRIHGTPYRQNVTLSTIVGGGIAFVDVVHLEGFNTALKSEVDEIESLLHQGVIL